MYNTLSLATSRNPQRFGIGYMIVTNTYQLVGAQLPARALEIKRGSIKLDVSVIWHYCCAVE
jgi:hypothetical protein